MGMARMLPSEVVRGAWVPGVLWLWEVRKREESRMLGCWWMEGAIQAGQRIWWGSGGTERTPKLHFEQVKFETL